MTCTHIHVVPCMLYYRKCVFHIECQTDLLWDHKLQIERVVLVQTAQFNVEMIKNNDRLTRYYTGMPTFDSFIALVEYVEPKTKDLISWNGKYTKDTYLHCGSLFC